VTAPAVVVVTLSPDELRALVREAVHEELANRAHALAPSQSTLVDRRELARALDVSPATVTRLQAEGMPCVHVGAAPRYALEHVRTWLDARGRQGTKAAPSKVREAIPGVRLLSRRR
jgi:hypothetical protein